MATTKKTYTLSKVKQLIDLNGDSVNFEVSFRINSHKKEPFEVLVVDQTTLDNNPSIEYKHVQNGEISGNIVHDKNVYQNYFIILKADNPCNCDVEITKKELPKTPQPPPELPKKMDMLVPAPNSGLSFSKILLIVGVIIFLGLGFYMFSKSSPNKAEMGMNKTPEGFKMYSPAASEAGENPILSRLKKLNI